MLELKHISKTYYSKSTVKVAALNDVSISFPRKGLFFIIGKSGCGKTTLLNILGGLDAPTSGEVYFDGEKIDLINMRVADNYRRQSIGFVFQNFNLLDNETVTENVNVAAQLVGKSDEDVVNAISCVGLSEQSKQYVNELSGGQKQRVAIARALVKDSKVILADEPTGNLDSSNAVEVFRLLKALSVDRLIIVVTHDNESAEKYGDGIVRIADGKITDNSICNFGKTAIERAKKTNENSYSIKKSTLFKFGIKNIGYKKGRSVLTALVLLLSVTVLLWAQMLLSTTSEKVLGRELKTYNQQQILLYQSSNLDEGVLNYDGYRGNHPDVSPSALRYIHKNTNALPLTQLDMLYVGIIENKDSIKNLGFELCDNSLEMVNSDYIYVSDYLFDETYALRNGSSDYDEYIGKAVTVCGKQGILAGVFKTNYFSYVNWDYQFNRFEIKGSLKEAEQQEIAFINSFLKNIFFCSWQYYTEYNLNGYTFNSIVRASKRRNGVTNYYGLTEVTFSTDYSDVTITDEVRIIDKANNSRFDDSGEYIEEYLIPKENEIYISRSLYRKLFEFNYEENAYSRYLGSKINISLCENGNNIILSSVNGKILVGVYGDETGPYSFSISKETNEDFKKYGMMHPFTIVNISEISATRLTEFLTGLRKQYEVVTKSMLSSWVYYVVEDQFKAASIIMSAVAVVMFLTALLLIVNLVAVIITNKTNEIGILRAMGMRSNDIIFIYLIKIIFLSIISFGLSVIGGLIGIPILAKGFMSDNSLFISWISFDWLTLIIGVIMGIVMPILLSAVRLRNINKMKPIDAIKNL